MRAEKELLRDEIKGLLEQYQSFVIMSYSGFSANKANNFRNEVAKMGGAMEVVRKRVLMKAAENAGVNLDTSMLKGHIGLVFSGADFLQTAKFVCKASKDAAKEITVLGGRFDGILYGAEQVQILSELPSKDEMRSQFLATLEAPMSHTISVMEALLTSVMHCMDNKSKQQES